MDENKLLSEHELSKDYWSDKDEENESDVDKIECENPSPPILNENSLFDLEDDGINDDLSSFELHDNQLVFYSYNEENENGVEEIECDLACVPPSQVNDLFYDSSCIDDDIPLMEPCWIIMRRVVIS